MNRSSITILRVTVGLTFVAHGIQKLFLFGIEGVAGAMGQMGLPFPFASAVLATGAEFFGGLLLLVGLGTRFAAVPVAFTMLVAMLQVHLKGGYFLPSGIEYTLVLFAANIILIMTGSGALALDNVITRRKHDSDPSSQRAGSREPRVA